MKGQHLTSTDLAGVSYLGSAGVTADCLRGIARLLCSGDLLIEVRLVTYENFHAFVFLDHFEDVFVVKNGFTSGYAGEGPAGLSTALTLLQRHGIPVEEYAVNEAFMHRLEMSCLLQKDLDWLANASPIRPKRWYEYIDAIGRRSEVEDRRASEQYLLAVPFRLMDRRLWDLAISFHQDPDRAIGTAYRRLEDIVRARTDIKESGTKLFSRTFLADDSPLTWAVPDSNEAKARATMFTAVFGAFRNARMHREQSRSNEEELREFILINELFLLEATSIERRHLDSDD